MKPVKQLLVLTALVGLCFAATSVQASIDPGSLVWSVPYMINQSQTVLGGESV